MFAVVGPPLPPSVDEIPVTGMMGLLVVVSMKVTVVFIVVLCVLVNGLGVVGQVFSGGGSGWSPKVRKKYQKGALFILPMLNIWLAKYE